MNVSILVDLIHLNFAVDLLTDKICLLLTREEVAVFQATDSGVNRRDEEESEKLLWRARFLVCCKVSYLVGKMAQTLSKC